MNQQDTQDIEAERIIVKLKYSEEQISAFLELDEQCEETAAEQAAEYQADDIEDYDLANPEHWDRYLSLRSAMHEDLMREHIGSIGLDWDDYRQLLVIL